MGKTFGMSGDETELSPWDWAPWKFWRDQCGTALVTSRRRDIPRWVRNELEPWDWAPWEAKFRDLPCWEYHETIREIRVDQHNQKLRRRDVPRWVYHETIRTIRVDQHNQEARRRDVPRWEETELALWNWAPPWEARRRDVSRWEERELALWDYWRDQSGTAQLRGKTSGDVSIAYWLWCGLVHASLDTHDADH